jgi:hypothetical protein
LRCRAVGTCFSQHATEQNRSFSRPALHDATVQRIAEVPGGISLRQVAQTRLVTGTELPDWSFDIHFLKNEQPETGNRQRATGDGNRANRSMYGSGEFATESESAIAGALSGVKDL